MSLLTNPLNLLTKQGISLGMIESVSVDSVWNHGRFLPSPDFDLVEALFTKRRELIEEQLFTHEDMLSDAIQSLGLSINGDNLSDFHLNANGGCSWKLDDSIAVSESQRTASPPIFHKQSA